MGIEPFSGLCDSDAIDLPGTGQLQVQLVVNVWNE